MMRATEDDGVVVIAAAATRERWVGPELVKTVGARYLKVNVIRRPHRHVDNQAANTEEQEKPSSSWNRPQLTVQANYAFLFSYHPLQYLHSHITLLNCNATTTFSYLLYTHNLCNGPNTSYISLPYMCFLGTMNWCLCEREREVILFRSSLLW